MTIDTEGDLVEKAPRDDKTIYEQRRLINALEEQLKAEKEGPREREGTLRSSERQNEALREENGALRELKAAQREELRSLKQQGGHVDDRRTTGHELGYQDSRIEQLKAQLRSGRARARRFSRRLGRAARRP